MSTDKDQVEIYLKTNLPDKYRLDSGSTLVVESSMDRLGLSALVNDLLVDAGKIYKLDRRPFDFLIDGSIFLRDNLKDICEAKYISSEQRVNLEYVFALQTRVISDIKNDINDGLSSVTNMPHTKDVFVTGSIGGNLSIISMENHDDCSRNLKQLNSTIQISKSSILCIDSSQSLFYCGLRSGEIVAVNNEIENIAKLRTTESSPVVSICATADIIFGGYHSGEIAGFNTPETGNMNTRELTTDDSVSEDYNSARFSFIHSHRGHAVTGICTIGGNCILSVGLDSTARLRDYCSHTLISSRNCGRPITASCLLFNGNNNNGESNAMSSGTSFVTGHDDGRISLWDLRVSWQSSSPSQIFDIDLSQKERYDVCERKVTRMVWKPNSSYVFASGCLDGYLRLFDIRSPRVAIQASFNELLNDSSNSNRRDTETTQVAQDNHGVTDLLWVDNESLIATSVDGSAVIHSVYT